MSRRTVLLVVMTLLVILNSTATGIAKINIAIGSWSIHEYCQQMVNAFNESQDRIEVKIEAIANYHDAVSVAMAAGVGPDIVHCPTGKYEWVDMLIDLTPYWERSAQDIDPEDYIPYAFRDNVIHGKMFQLVHGTPYIRILYYLPSMFEEAGLISPIEQHQNGDWTWNGVVTTAKKLTNDVDGDGETDVYGLSWDINWYLPEIVRQAGGRQYSSDGKTFTADRPEFIEAVQWLADLTNVHGVNRTPTGSLGNLYSGSAAISPYSTIGVSYMAANSQVDWDVAPFFNRPERRPFLRPPGWSAYGITPSCEHPDAAWEFIFFTITRKAQMEIAKVGGDTPILLDAINSPEWLERPDVHNLGYVMRTAIEQIYEPEGVRHVPEPQIEKLLSEAVLSVGRGEKPASVALKEIAPAAQRLLDGIQDKVIFW